jgi:hypothetical protein
MSKRDGELVRALGLSVAQMAKALGRSRQTVNRGISQQQDYFKPADLAEALGYWRGSKPDLYMLARQKIRDLYPEIAKAVLDATGAPDALPLSADVPGQYWFITGDFVALRNNLPRCAKQLEELCGHKGSEVTLFVNQRDEVPARRLAARFPKSARMILCQIDLRLVPSTLLRMDTEDNMDMFGASDSGFIALSRQEAARLRVSVQDILLSP